jgi:hypothetical protein
MLLFDAIIWQLENVLLHFQLTTDSSESVGWEYRHTWDDLTDRRDVFHKEFAFNRPPFSVAGREILSIEYDCQWLTPLPEEYDITYRWSSALAELAVHQLVNLDSPLTGEENVSVHCDCQLG